jgi:hypothetical protein
MLGNIILTQAAASSMPLKILLTGETAFPILMANESGSESISLGLPRAKRPKVYGPFL